MSNLVFFSDTDLESRTFPRFRSSPDSKLSGLLFPFLEIDSLIRPLPLRTRRRIGDYFLTVRNVRWKWRAEDEKRKRGVEGRGVWSDGTPRQKAQRACLACVLSCVVGNGPPARTTSHRYLLVSVSLGGKSISFRRYCAHLFVQAPGTLTASMS